MDAMLIEPAPLGVDTDAPVGNELNNEGIPLLSERLGNAEVLSPPVSEGSNGLACETPLIEEVTAGPVEDGLLVVHPEAGPELEAAATDEPDDVTPESKPETSLASPTDVRLRTIEPPVCDTVGLLRGPPVPFRIDVAARSMLESPILPSVFVEIRVAFVKDKLSVKGARSAPSSIVVMPEFWTKFNFSAEKAGLVLGVIPVIYV